MLTNDQPTWASILLFGMNPQSPLTQAQVHCGRFKKEIVIIDDRIIDGPIADQVEEVMDFIRKNINVRFVITGKPRREEIWDYPLEALREAVVNAFCHRDYSMPSDIQIKIHDDRIQIWNPGRLPFGITVEELYQPSHSSIPRNKQIAGIFYDMGLIERYGSGIQRIISLCREAGLPQPLFKETSGGFLAMFKKHLTPEERFSDKDLNERQINAVKQAEQTGSISNREYRTMHNISARTALRDLKDLTEKRILKKSNKTGRTTVYVPASPNPP